MEAVFSILALRDHLIPPTANLHTPDPEVDLNIIRDEPHSTAVKAVMSNSFGFGGQNTVLIFTSS